MCHKTSKTIEYYKIFLRWIIKRAHGILFEDLFPQVAVAARHGLDEWCQLGVGAGRQQTCQDWQTQKPQLPSQSPEFRRQLQLVANHRIVFPTPF
jgi:hypothetical protein